MKIFKTIFIIVFPLLLTVNLWILSKSDFKLVISQPYRSFGQIFGLLGIVLMSLTLVLTTRNKKIEELFGGMDKVYSMHHILGAVSFVFIVNHPLLLAIQSLPNLKTALLYLYPGIDLAYNLGIFAVYFMILSFIFMVFIKLPYHIWKITHQFLGVSFLLGAIHSLIIVSDVSAFPPLKIWIGFMIGIGLISVSYTIFFYQSLGPKFSYEIERIERSLDIINIYLRPVGKRVINFLPGQFVYVRFNNRTVGTEPHPFSISSAPSDQLVRLTIKITGDYTLRLPNLKKNDKTYLFGPYGSFGQNINKESSIWIGGGIGITPILSILRNEASRKEFKSTKIYYCYKTPEEGVFNDEIERLVQDTPDIKFIKWCTEENRRLTASRIIGLQNIDEVNSILCCGPPIMMESLKKQFVDLGLPEEKFYNEEFSTGL
ncbi:MAG: ferric reductase-like transmembrane domain-containing protein [Patescibacteria group bacterium]|jgi:predicted ferric reductase